MNELLDGDINANNLPEGKLRSGGDALMALGRTSAYILQKGEQSRSVIGGRLVHVRTPPALWSHSLVHSRWRHNRTQQVFTTHTNATLARSGGDSLQSGGHRLGVVHFDHFAN